MDLRNLLVNWSKKYFLKKDSTLINLVLASIISLGIGTATFIIVNDMTMNRARTQFRTDSIYIAHQIHYELNRYKDLLYHTKSFLATTEDLTQDKFKNYVKGIDMVKYPSLNSFNYIESIDKKDVKNYYTILQQEYLNSDIDNITKKEIIKALEKNTKEIKNNNMVNIIKYFEPLANNISNIGKPATEKTNASLELEKSSKEINYPNEYILSKKSSSQEVLSLFFRLGVFDINKLYKGSIGLSINLDENLFQRTTEMNDYINFIIFDKTSKSNQIVYDSRLKNKSLIDPWLPMPNINNSKFHENVLMRLAMRDYEIYTYSNILPPNMTDQKIAFITALLNFCLTLFLITRWFDLKDDKSRAYRIAEKMTEEIRNIAYNDSLTNLPNRQAFLEDLEKSLIEYPNESLYVMFLDLDGFKKVNDTLGHYGGDEVLKIFASRLNSLATTEPIKCYRIGGDEFIVILEARLNSNKLNSSYLDVLAKKLLSLTKQSFSISGEDFSLSLSIGIAQYPLDGKTSHELFKNSDVAMYETKRKGKNNYAFYNQNLSTSLEKKNQIESLLLLALDKKEFSLVFQPKLHRVGSDFIPIGAEVLLRWKNEKLGDVCPYKFIPIVEEIGMMPKLGMWVFEESVKKISYWKSKGIEDIKISINLSVHQFSDINMVKKISEILNKYNVSSNQIILEITESTMMHDVDSSHSLLEEFTNLGFQISIDDFGTGYSSLSYLRKYPVNEIKIDRSFTQDVLEDGKDRLVISAIIDLAQKLGLNVVVEGVETKEQLDWFDIQGKLQVQGYYFSKPVVEKDFLAFWHQDCYKKKDIIEEDD